MGKQTDFTYQNGQKVSDVVTKFSGTITGRVQYLTGCNQYLVTPEMKADGTSPDPRWYDEDRLVTTGQPQLELPTAGSDGADCAAPIK